MEARGEPMAPNTHHLFIKGRRSKRQRLQSPISTASASSSAASGEDVATASPTTTYNQEEEDMANCLILLAQGQARRRPPLAYQCRTCGRCFPTFQALGGHRTSHKKAARAAAAAAAAYEERVAMNIGEKACSVSNNGGRRKTHDCSVCGAEFSSGQALGGHMRRHRLAVNGAPAAEVLVGGGVGVSYCGREESMLILDLNLPAPEEDRQKESRIVSAGVMEGDRLELSFSSLVGFCHY